MSDILGQDLNVLLVGECHGGCDAIGARRFAHMHFQPWRNTRHVRACQGVKRHRFERWEGVVPGARGMATNLNVRDPVSPRAQRRFCP